MEENTQAPDEATENVEVEDVPLGVPADADPAEDDESPGFPRHDPTEG